MPADKTIIDTMARALWLEDASNMLNSEHRLGRLKTIKAIDLAQYDENAGMPLSGPGFRRQWEGQARAALQAMIEAGPTTRMSVIGGLELAEDEKPEGFPYVAAEVYRAMLRAALEEAGNHG